MLLAEGHRLIAPWSERVRYGAKKNGYHGGLTPQEMVIPITVVTSTKKVVDVKEFYDTDLSRGFVRHGSRGCQCAQLNGGRGSPTHFERRAT